VALGVVAVGLVVRLVADVVVRRKLLPVLQRTRFVVDHLLAEAARGPVCWALFLVAAAGAMAVLGLPREPNVHGAALGLVKVLFVLDVLWFLMRVVSGADEWLAGKAEGQEGTTAAHVSLVVRKTLRVLRVALVVVFAVWLVQFLGVRALLAQLGLGSLPVWGFLGAFVFVLLGFTGKKLSDYLFGTVIVPWLRKTRFVLDHLLAEAASAPAGYMVLLLGFSGAFGVMVLPREPNVHGFAFGALKVLMVADILWFLFRLVDCVEGYLRELAARTESSLDDQMVPMIRKALKATIAVMGFVWVVQLLGYSVSTLLAGLGIGGLAVALAFQDTLANFFGSVFIFLDRPFVVGDWVKIGEAEGFVEEIGFRSTRIRTLPTTLVSIPNKHVADSAIENLSKMPHRRVLQTVGLTYETNAAQMEGAVGAIKELVEADPGVDKETIVVRFQEFGASSLDVLVLYFTTAIPLAEHLETKERVNLAILRKVEGLGLSMAFPTQTVYFEGDIAKSMAGGS